MASVLVASLAFGACTHRTETRAAPTGESDGTETPPSATEVEPAPPEDAGPPPERSVKGTWERVEVKTADGDPLTPLRGVFVRAADDVYVSEGQSNLGTGFYHWNGQRWTGVRYYGLAANLVGVPSGELLGYGESIYIKAKTGDAWEIFPAPTTSAGAATVLSIWGGSLDDLYASTGRGNAHFDGASWAAVSGVGDGVGSFAGTSTKDVWFSSPRDNELSHYDGARWQNQWSKLPEDVKTTPYEGPYGFFASSPDNTWALGRARTVLRYDGTNWSVTPGPDDEWGCDLTAGWTSSKANAWLVGRGGCVFHWDGTAWERLASGVTDDLAAVHGAGPENVWIATATKTVALRLRPE